MNEKPSTYVPDGTSKCFVKIGYEKDAPTFELGSDMNNKQQILAELDSLACSLSDIADRLSDLRKAIISGEPLIVSALNIVADRNLITELQNRMFYNSISPAVGPIYSPVESWHDLQNPKVTWVSYNATNMSDHDKCPNCESPDVMILPGGKSWSCPKCEASGPAHPRCSR